MENDLIIIGKFPRPDPYIMKLETEDDVESLFDVLTSFKSDSRKNFVYRGQSNYRWHLQPSLERVIGKAMDIRSSLASKQKLKYEKRVIGGHFFSNIPIDGQTCPDFSSKALKFAFIQHYGGPTRLLDFTYNFMVALFFALRDLPKTNASLYMINQFPLYAHTHEKFEDEPRAGLDTYLLDQEDIF